MSILSHSLLVAFSATDLLIASADMGSANGSVITLQGDDGVKTVEISFDPPPDQAGQCKGNKCAAGGSY